jgi:hypothetical protein
MAKGIKADDIEALLSGNLKLDEDGIRPWIPAGEKRGEIRSNSEVQILDPSEFDTVLFLKDVVE